MPNLSSSFSPIPPRRALRLRPRLLRLAAGLAALAAVLGAPTAARAAEPKFGLDGPTLVRVGPGASDLLAGDFNGDGLADLAVVINAKSMLEIHLRKPGATLSFEKREVVIDQFVNNAAAMDIDGDGRTDILLAGSPGRLSVIRQSTTGASSAPERLDAEASYLRAGDLDGDGVDDLVLVNGRRGSCVPYGKRGLDWGAAQTFWSSTDLRGAPELLDVNADGARDLLFRVAGGDRNEGEQVLVRFQRPGGSFPDETRIGLPALDDWTALNGRDRAGAIVAVSSATGGLQTMLWHAADPSASKADDASSPADPRQYLRLRTVAFEPDAVRGEAMASALVPLEGGRVPALAVASLASPSLRVLRAESDGSLRASVAPFVSGAGSLLHLPAKAEDGATWIAGISQSENAFVVAPVAAKSGAIGVFQPVTTGGRPRAAAVLGVASEATAVDLAVLVQAADAAQSLEIHRGFDPATRKSASVSKLALQSPNGANLPAQFSGIVAGDFDRDGRADVMLVSEYTNPAIYLQASDGAFAPAPAGESSGAEWLSSIRTVAALSVAPLSEEKPSLLVCRENFARAYHLEPGGAFAIDAQFNGRNARSRIGSAVAFRTGPDAPPAVALLDTANRCVTIYGRAKPDGAFDQVRHFDLDDANYLTLRAADLNEDGRDDLLLVAPDRVSVLTPGIAEGRLETRSTARTDVEDGRYRSIIPVSLIPKSPQQILAVESNETMAEFYRVDAETGALERFYRFKVFERDSSGGRQGPLGVEPREALATDLSGDGKPDLVFLMNDVLGLYVQK